MADVVVAGVPVHDEMGVRRLDDLVEFAVDDFLAGEAWQALVDVTPSA